MNTEIIGLIIAMGAFWITGVGVMVSVMLHLNNATSKRVDEVKAELKADIRENRQLIIKYIAEDNREHHRVGYAEQSVREDSPPYGEKK